MALLLVVGSALLSGQWLYETQRARQLAQRITAESGIEIGYGEPASFWVEPYTAEDALAPGLAMQAVDTHSALIAMDGIEAALQQYPRGFVSRFVSAIFICGELRMGGARAGGTAAPAWIILAAPPDIGDEAIRLTAYLGVHHELSSYVLRQDASTMETWAAFAPRAARFVPEANAALARQNDPEPDPAEGFLSAYGATNAENDFNVYAEKIFSEPQDVLDLARRYPLVERKLDFVLATYAALDPRLQDTFHKLGFER